MIILKNHFNRNDTAIYGDIVCNGCQTFHINQLDEVCEKFRVPVEIKQDVIKHHQENIGNDDMSANILEQLKTENNGALNHAVAFATENQELLEEMLSLFGYDRKMKVIITNKENLTENLIKKLSEDKDFNVRLSIANRVDLSDNIIKNLAKDHTSIVRCTIANRLELSEPLIQELAKHQEWDVRAIIAERNDVSKSILYELAKDEDSMVRSAVAGRSDLDQHLIQELSKDKMLSVRYTLDKHSSSSQQLAKN